MTPKLSPLARYAITISTNIKPASEDSQPSNIYKWIIRFGANYRKYYLQHRQVSEWRYPWFLVITGLVKEGRGLIYRQGPKSTSHP